MTDITPKPTSSTAGEAVPAVPAAHPAPPTLAYRPTGPGAKAAARRVRWGMAVLGAWLVGTVLLYNPLTQVWEPLGLGLYGTPLVPVDEGGDDTLLKVRYLLTTAAYLGAMLLAQGLFLLPRGPLAFRLVERGRPMRLALLMAAAAGMIAMLLTVGLLATLADAPAWWVRLWEQGSGGPAGLRPLHGVWLTMGVLWAAWAWVFFRYARDRDHRTAAAKITRALLAGTVLELLVSGPAHVWALRKHAGDSTDCYCARGSYTGLVFGCTALVWLFGPGVLLLVLREKRRREEVGGGIEGDRT